MKYSLALVVVLLFSSSVLASDEARYVKGKIVNINKEAKTISIKEVKSRDLVTYNYNKDASKNIHSYRKGERVELMLTAR